MLNAVSGYYNGNQIVMDEQISLRVGQRVIITILERNPEPVKNLDLKKYAGRGEKMFHGNVEEYLKELRENDRL